MCCGQAALEKNANQRWLRTVIDGRFGGEKERRPYDDVEDDFGAD